MTYQRFRPRDDATPLLALTNAVGRNITTA